MFGFVPWTGCAAAKLEHLGAVRPFSLLCYLSSEGLAGLGAAAAGGEQELEWRSGDDWRL